MPSRILEKFIILIVDDDEINRAIIRLMLRGVNVIIEIAEDGKAALDFLKLNPGKDIIMLLDINMPIMDGYEVIRQMRDNRSFYKMVRTIVLSANNYVKFQDSGLEAEVSCYLQKPIDNDLLIEKIIAVSNNE